MDQGWSILIAGLAAALITGIAGYLGVRYQHRSREHQAEQARLDEAAGVLRKYRDPLVRAAFDLQSRLYNIIVQDFLGKYLTRGTKDERQYALESSLFVIADYFGWVELMRREIQFLDLRDVARNRELGRRLDAIGDEFLGQREDTTFRVFRGEMRAIGEIMITTLPGGSRECIGFAAFTERREDRAFSRWFDKLERDIALLAREPGQHVERIVDIQCRLVDLIEFLDPDRQYFPENMRVKATSPSAAVASPNATEAAPVGGLSASAS